jgi:pyruvate/2-oxoglutarate dehydrogenase complex dihydrolipoamide dehydrogenase (E3) component
MSAVTERKRNMVASLVEMYLDQCTKSGTELVMGAGHFVAPKTIQVTPSKGGTRTLRGKYVVINTGYVAALESIPSLQEAAPLTHIEALELDELPKRLWIIGGGYIVPEFAQASYHRGDAVRRMTAACFTPGRTGNSRFLPPVAAAKSDRCKM